MRAAHLNSQRSARGPGHGLHKPEGRRRQDDHGDQPGCLPRSLRYTNSRHRSRPAGQCHERPRNRPPRGRRLLLRGTRRPLADGGSGDLDADRRASTSCPRPRRSPGPKSSWWASSARERRLAASLSELNGSYQRILIDCPPSLGLLTLNALTAADGVLIPIQTEYYALEGLSQLVNTIRRVREGLNPRLEIEGVRADDVRRPDEPVGAGRVRGAASHERDRLRHRRPAFGAPLGGPQPRPADRAVRPRVPRRQRVSRRLPGRSPPVASMPARGRSLRSRTWPGRADPEPRRGAAACSSCRSTASRRTRTSHAPPSTRRRSASWRPRSPSTACSSRSSCEQLADGGYQLVAGERRLRAARMAGLEAIPAVIRDTDDEDRLARARAHREHPARGPQPDRDRARLPGAHRSLRADPRGRRPPGRQEPGRDQQLAAPARPRARRRARRSSRAASPRATAARWRRSPSPSSSAPSSSIVARAPAVGAPDRGARSPQAGRGARPRARARSAPTSPTSRHSCAACWRRRSASCARGAAAGSSSTSTPTRSSTASTRSSPAVPAASTADGAASVDPDHEVVPTP